MACTQPVTQHTGFCEISEKTVGELVSLAAWHPFPGLFLGAASLGLQSVPTEETDLQRVLLSLRQDLLVTGQTHVPVLHDKRSY